MNLHIIENNVRQIVGDVRADTLGPYEASSQIMSIFVTEMWPYKSDEYITLDRLTESDMALLTVWLIHNRRSYHDNQIGLIKDMREVFPGLGLAPAAYMVRGR